MDPEPRIFAEKLSVIVPVSRELLEQPPPLTAEEQAQRYTEAMQRLEARRAAVAALASEHPALNRVAGLHSPHGGGPYPHCRGCDDSRWEWCTTIDAMLDES